MRPFRVSLKYLQCQHQAYVLLQNSSESGHVAHKIKKKMKRRKLAPHQHPTPHTPKKTLHLHCQTPRKSKTYRSELEEQITNM